MRNVVMLFNRLNSELPFEKKYPQYNAHDAMVHVLYVSPFFNATGFYRMIAPMLELHRTSTHRAIVSQIHKWDFSKQFDDYDNPLDERLIKWAHYIVLPPVFTDITYVLNLIKSHNQEVVTLIDLDGNYLELGELHPLSGKINQEMRKTLLNNLFLVNGIISSGEALSERVEELVRRETGKQIKRPYVLESKISEEGFVDFKGVREEKKRKRKTDVVRVGLIASAADWQDIEGILPVLEELQQEEKSLELLLFGWSGVFKGEDKMGNLFYRYVKPVRIDEYYAKLRDLELDVVLLPLKDDDFNRGKTAVKFLEASVLGIPVVASNHFIYKDKIIDGKNGFLAEEKKEWKEKIISLIRDKKFREQMGENARRLVWKNWSYEYGGIKTLLEIFK